jgi:hypothetical protein
MKFLESWRREARGELTLDLGETVMRISPLVNGWLLHCPNFEFVGNSLDDLEGAVGFYIGYVERNEQRRGNSEASITEDLGDGFELTATANNRLSFQVEIRRNGEIVGRYDGFPNNPTATFVLGQDTIQGAEMLDPIARRRGFGDKMRDAAERITGLVAVPHGRHFTYGSLSDAAAKSWERRATDKNVPGYGTDLGLQLRHRMVSLGRKRLGDARIHAVDLTSAMALAERTGFPLMIAYSNGRPRFGWVVAPDGIPFDPSGSVNPVYLKETASSNGSPYKVTFKQMTFRKADAIIKDWRNALSEDRQEYVNETVAFLDSPKRRELADTVTMPPDTTSAPRRENLSEVPNFKVVRGATM